MSDQPQPVPGPANIADPIILPMPAGQKPNTVREWILSLQARKTVPIRSEEERQALLHLLEHAIPQDGLTLALLNRLRGRVAAARGCSVFALNNLPVAEFVGEVLALVEEPATVEAEPTATADGTLTSDGVWLRGHHLWLPHQAAHVLAFLILNPGISTEDAADKLGLAPVDHFHNRLYKLRKKLASLPKRIPFRVQIVCGRETGLRVEVENSPQNSPPGESGGH